MIEINLLPKELQWKRFRFTVDKKLLILLGVGAGVVLCLAAYSYVYQAGKISTIRDNIVAYRMEADQYAAEIKKIDEIAAKNEQVLARISAVKILDRNRDYWVGLLQDVIKRVPEYLWLIDLQEGSAATVARPASGTTAPVPSSSTIEGFAFSLNAVATFIVRLKKSDILSNIEVSSIILQETEKSRAYLFKLTCNFNAPGTPAPTETAPTPGTAGGQF
jgi:Tfp pilus assembly protein PilN